MVAQALGSSQATTSSTGFGSSPRDTPQGPPGSTASTRSRDILIPVQSAAPTASAGEDKKKKWDDLDAFYGDDDEASEEEEEESEEEDDDEETGEEEASGDEIDDEDHHSGQETRSGGQKDDEESNSSSGGSGAEDEGSEVRGDPHDGTSEGSSLLVDGTRNSGPAAGAFQSPSADDLSGNSANWG